MSWIDMSAHFLLIVVIAEAVFFWVYANKLLKFKIQFPRILLVIGIANIVTALIGMKAGKSIIDSSIYPGNRINALKVPAEMKDKRVIKFLIQALKDEGS